MLNIFQLVKEMSERIEKALIPRMKPETAAPTHSVIFLPGCEQKKFISHVQETGNCKKTFLIKTKT